MGRPVFPQTLRARPLSPSKGRPYNAIQTMTISALQCDPPLQCVYRPINGNDAVIWRMLNRTAASNRKHQARRRSVGVKLAIIAHNPSFGGRHLPAHVDDLSFGANAARIHGHRPDIIHFQFQRRVTLASFEGRVNGAGPCTNRATSPRSRRAPRRWGCNGGGPACQRTPRGPFPLRRPGSRGSDRWAGAESGPPKKCHAGFPGRSGGGFALVASRQNEDPRHFRLAAHS